MAPIPAPKPVAVPQQQEGGFLSRLTGALTDESMLPWLSLAMAPTRQAQWQGFTGGIERMGDAERLKERQQYERQQDALRNQRAAAGESRAQQSFKMKMEAFEREKAQRQKMRELRTIAAPRLAEQMGVGEDMAELILQARPDAMFNFLTEEEVKPLSTVGKVNWDVSQGFVTPEQRDAKLAKSGITINNNLATGIKPKDIPEPIWNEIEQAKSASRDLGVIAEATKILDAGIRTGFGAGMRNEAAKAADLLGLPVDEELLANTDAFVATAGRRVAEIIKQFGAGTGLSDADREYAEKIAGGSIAVDEAAIRKLFEIAVRTNRNLIAETNAKLGPLLSEPNIAPIAPFLTADPPDYGTPSTSDEGVVDYTDYF